MLPLAVLKGALNQPMLVELKNGETYNGNLVSVDQYMNLSLSDVICTSKDGARFWRLPTALVRGPAIKYLRIPEDVLDHMPAEDAGMAESGAFAGRGGGAAGGGGGRGGGRGGYGGGGRGGRMGGGRGGGAGGGRGGGGGGGGARR